MIAVLKYNIYSVAIFSTKYGIKLRIKRFVTGYL